MNELKQELEQAYRAREHAQEEFDYQCEISNIVHFSYSQDITEAEIRVAQIESELEQA